MNPGMFAAGGGAQSGGGSDNAGDAGKDKEGAGTENGGKDGSGEEKDANGSGPADDECKTEGHPVDVATGRMFTNRNDFVIRGVFDFAFRRAYCTEACEENACGLGFGWRHAFAWTIEVGRRSVLLIDETGTRQTLPVPSAGESIRWTHGRTLRRNPDGSFELVTRDTLVREFVATSADRTHYVLSRVRDANGNAITIHRDQGRITQFTDTVGRSIRVVYGNDGNIASIECKNAVSNGRWIPFARYRYSDQGDLIEALDAEDYALRYRYQDHLLIAETNRIGLTYHFRYDSYTPRARCIETWGDYEGKPDPALADGLPRRMKTHTGDRVVKGIYHRVFHYGSHNNTEVYDTRDGQRRYRSNNLGLVDKEVGAGGGTITRQLDEYGDVVTHVDADEAVWQWKRDDRGRVVESIDPLGRRFRFRYGEHNDPLEIVAPNDGIWTFEYDRFGNRTMGKDPLGAVTSWKYDERGLVVDVETPRGAHISARRDPHANVVAVKTPRGEMLLSYDYFGRLLGVRRADGAEMHFQYSDRGDLIYQRDVRGQITRFQYDGEGNLIAVFYPDGTVTRAVIGGDGWLVELRDARGIATKCRYDYEGDLVEVINGRGEKFKFTYNRAGQVIRVDTFDGRVIEHFYTPGGLRRKMRAGDGAITLYGYDKVGNLIEQSYADGSTDRYVYDALDCVIEAQSAEAFVSYERDACCRILKEKHVLADQSFEVTSAYDPSGFRLSRKIGAQSVAWERDALGECIARIFDGKHRQKLELDVAARPVRSTFGASEIERWYDPSGLTTRTRASRPSATGGGRDTVIDRAFEFSPVAELIREIDAVRGETRFVYDPIAQLLERTTTQTREAFDYDATYNRAPANVPMKVAPGDRLMELGGTRLEWNDAGQVVAKIRRTSDGEETWRFEWHPSGCLQTVTTPKGEKIRYEYDAFGRRTRKVTPTDDVLFVWDSNTLAAEVRKSGETRGYVFDEGGKMFVPIAQRSGDKWYQFVNTPAGTPTELVDDTGQVGWAATLKAYGEIEAEQRLQTDTALRFQGQYADEETGLHYNRFRYYDPELGRYLSADPISIEGGLNEFAYARNPIGWADPFGWEDGAALTAAMGGGKPPGHQAHHIIPEQLYNEHPLCQGMPPHTKENGIYLPQYKNYAVKPDGAQTVHRGSHPAYTKKVEGMLDEEYKPLKDKFGEPVPDCEKKKAIKRVQDKLRPQLHDGTIKCDGAGAHNNGFGLNNCKNIDGPKLPG